ncbi:MAG: 3D (Asp-Asp-Asp) domain-containing protein [Candidatus Paceibacteria bacterium]|jgi:3D (Asp-Asp-Asp) domain-containing protein
MKKILPIFAITCAAIAFAGNVNAETVTATVTGFNTVEGQTDSTPCIAASGDNICGRRDVVACPRRVPLGTWVEIKGKRYECLDRTHSKYNGRYDISFGKDVQAALNWGRRRVAVTILWDS